MTFKMRLFAVALSFLSVSVVPLSYAEGDGKPLSFPPAQDGRKVLAVDLHTHTVFSDGYVWPNIRVFEADRDGLSAIALTEHIEYQPHKKDIPHPDRNRSYQIAAEYAQDDLLVIRGAEITRGEPLGHINAVFLKDVNPLMGEGVFSVSSFEEYKEKILGNAISLDSAKKSIAVANAQQAFLFWNHPGEWTTGVTTLTDTHRQLIRDNALQGIEVVNGSNYWERAFQIALDNDLAIIGTSDIHGLIDWGAYNLWVKETYKEEWSRPDLLAGGHRTATLVLTDTLDEPSIKKALFARATVAIFRQSLIGRKPEVEAVVKGALSMEVVEHRPEMLTVRLINKAPIEFILQNKGDDSFDTHQDVFRVPARSSVAIRIKNIKAPEAFKELQLEALNTYTAPKRHLLFTLSVAGSQPSR